MTYHDIPWVFPCENSRLVGIATQPENTSQTGVLVVVGGPQYRAGSHRQFTLLARELASKGVASLRFDYREKGNSEGEMRNLESVNPDLRSTIYAFLTTVPEVRKVENWGLCDAASAALYYGYTDDRVYGLVLLTPWLHTEESAKRARVKHYYSDRFMQKSFWIKLFKGEVRFIESIVEFASSIRSYLLKQQISQTSASSSATSHIERMLAGLIQFPGKILIILSGNDLVAQEFQELADSDEFWKSGCQSPKIRTQIIADANHTFSSRLWCDQALLTTWNWLKEEF